MFTRENEEKKVALIDNKLKNEDYESALNLLDLAAKEIKEEKFDSALSLINKAIEIERTEDSELNILRLTLFEKIFMQKIFDKKFEEIPKLFEIGNKYKFKTKEMENFLDINKHLSICFEYKYLVKYTKKETYENIILNILEYIRKGINGDNFELKFGHLKRIFSEDIEKDSDLFLNQVKQNNNKNGIFNYKVELELYENIINKINKL